MNRQSLPTIAVVVLAGGRGTRIRSHFPHVPKPMIPIDGRPFLYWLTAFLANHGLRRFIYSTGHMAEQIETWCNDGSMKGLERTTKCEAMPLGTGGGLLNAIDSGCDWTLVTNGDSLCLGGVDALLGLTIKRCLAGGIIGVFQDDTSRFGSLDMDVSGRLRAFREKVGGQGYINSGIYLFRTSALRQIPTGVPSSIEHDVIPTLLAQNAQIQCIVAEAAPFIDIGTPETVYEAGNFVRSQIDQFTWPPA